MIKADFINSNYYFLEEHKVRGERFKEHYDLISEVSCEYDKMKFVNKQDRICYFCKEKVPKVKFTKDAHLIPELLGNRNLVYYSECDTCNEYFSKYENDLACFLGLDLTLNFVEGKKKKGGNRVPKFDSNKLRAEPKKDLDVEKISFDRLDLQTNIFRIASERTGIYIDYLKKPYVPINVYKIFVKIALTMLPSSHYNDYEFARNFLKQNDNCPYSGFEYLSFYRMPITFTFGKPTMMLFERKPNKSNVFRNMFIIFFQNTICQGHIPFSLTDRQLISSRKLEMVWSPAIFGSNDRKQIGNYIHEDCINMSNREKVNNEKSSVFLPMTDEQINEVSFRSIDGTISKEKLDIEKLKTLIIYRKK
jgi:hypothetical protein